MIEVDKLGKHYGSLEAVRNVSFEIDDGEVVGLLGPNGAGKTTILRILTCYIFPSYGTARVNGYDIFDQALEIKKSVGYLPENAPLYTDLNVMEYLDFIAESRSLTGNTKSERIEWIIEECELNDVVYRSIDKISRGFRQRTALAQAIIHNPEILILDEPTTGLDPNQIIEIRELIKRLGKKKTVILSTHILQEVEATCRRVLILNEGEIVARGTSEEIWREMKGETILSLTLIAASSQDKLPVTDSLSGLEGIKEIIETSKLAKNRLALKLSLDPEADAEEAIFDWAVERGYKIISMIPKAFSLEDIFIKLTREGGENAG